MLNKFTITFLIFIIVVIFVEYFHKKIPPILFPKIFQHATIGELPIVEVMDDGDFHERDGDEYDSTALYDSCISAVKAWCASGKFLITWGETRERTEGEKEECFKKTKQVCVNSPPNCFDLKKIGAGFTCSDSYYGGGIAWE